MLHPNPRITYETEISSEDIPSSIKIDDLINYFKKSSYHIGCWIQKNKEILLSDDATHVVHDVSPTENGIKIEYSFLNTRRFSQMRDNIKTKHMKFIPIVDKSKDSINNYRFDIIEEE